MFYQLMEQQNSSRHLVLMILLRNQALFHIQDRHLEPISEDIQKFAKAEGLTAHANSIRVRFDENDEI